MIRYILFAASLLSGTTWAFDCYLTFVKDSCWTPYDVTLTVTDTATSQVVTMVTVPRGKQFGRSTFSCQAKQILDFSAQFSPVFWQSDTGKVFKGIRYLTLPVAPQPGEVAWNLPVCYSADFAEVPLPPAASGECQCDFSAVPAIVVPTSQVVR